MGIYLNPNNDNFKKITSAEIYVDKTMMISKINSFIKTNKKYICVSLPRRFGKTFCADMISAYFSKGCDFKSIFSSFKILLL